MNNHLISWPMVTFNLFKRETCNHCHVFVTVSSGGIITNIYIWFLALVFICALVIPKFGSLSSLKAATHQNNKIYSNQIKIYTCIVL